MKKINLPFLAVGISFLPFYGYFIAYTYESSYLSVFDIPLFITQINISTILIVTIYLTFIIAISIATFATTQPLLKKYRKNFFIYPLIELVAAVGFLSILTILFNPKYLILLPESILVAIFLILFLEFLVPLLKIRSIKNYKANIIKNRLNTRKNKFNKSANIKNTYINLSLILLLIFLVTYLATSGLGSMVASLNSQYFVFTNNKATYALIRSYGSEKISIRYKGDEIIPGEIYIFNTDKLTLKKKQLKLPNNRRVNSLLRIN